MAKDREKEKDLKCCQELIESTFAFMRAYNHGTDYQKTTSKKKLKRCVDAVNERLLSAKVVEIKQKRVTSYRVSSPKETKFVSVIQME